MGLDYVDIFYSHRPDPETPLEETMAALDQAVRRARPSTSASPTTRRADRRAAADPESPRHALPHPPAPLLHVQPLDREGPARRAGQGGHRLHRLLPAGPGPAHRPLPGRHPEGLAGLDAPWLPAPRARDGGQGRAGAGSSTRSRRPAARPSPRWPCHGCCGSRSSPRPSSARAVSSSSTRTWTRSAQPPSPVRSWPASRPSSSRPRRREGRSGHLAQDSRALHGPAAASMSRSDQPVTSVRLPGTAPGQARRGNRGGSGSTGGRRG